MINREGEAVVRRIPWAPGSESHHYRLAPEDLAAVSALLEHEGFFDFRAAYGREAPANPRRVSLLYRWNGHEKAVVWRNPPSDPRPPEGWSRIIRLLDQIEQRAETDHTQPAATSGQRPCACASMDTGNLMPTSSRDSCPVNEGTVHDIERKDVGVDVNYGEVSILRSG